MSEQLIYHKKTFFPSSYLAAQFYNFNSEQIYFSSGNKLILFDVIKNQKIFRINLRGKKIIYFSQSDIDNDELFVLDIDNCFYQFKISTKEVVSSLQLNRDNKYYTFQMINNKVYFYNNFTLSIAEVVLTDKGTEIKLVKEYSILSQKIQNNIVKDKDSLNKPCQFIIKNDILVTSYENILLVHNLVSKNTTQINFYKKISTLSFINSSDDSYSICIGDTAGKIHILSDVTDKNYVISTKHWHSHRVNCILSEENGHNIYTAGQEGVVVIWDLNSNIKNFLPRLNGNIISLKISKDRKYLMCYMSNNTIKIISLSEMKIVNEISSIPDNTDITKCSLFTNKQQFLTFLNKESGLLQFYNIGQNSFPFYLNILNKNYSSKTENEQLNFKQLTNVAFSKNKEESYMLTSEEINYNENTRTTYLKFWRVTQDNIELLCSAENSHLNERIIAMGGNNNIFITCSDSFFKVWEMNKEYKYTCTFMSKYKNKKLTTATITSGKTIYALFEKYLIQYENKKIKKVFLLPIEGHTVKLLKGDTLLCIYNKNDVVLFDTHSWGLSWRESTSSPILKVIENNESLDILIHKNDNVVYLLKYSLSTYKEIEDEGMIIEKKSIKYIDVYKKYIVIVNTKNDIFIAGREGVKKKEEMEDRDIEL